MDAIQEQCGADCWEEAHANFMETLAWCATNEDEVERAICEREANEEVQRQTEQC